MHYSKRPQTIVVSPKAMAFDLDIQLERLGRTSIALIKAGRLTDFDPLVSDWSCQMRVLWLIDAKKRIEQLTDHDCWMLGLYRLLTVTTNDDIDGLGMSRTQTTDGERRWPEEWEILTRKKTLEALGTAKKQLSHEMVDYLKSAISAHGLEVGPGLAENVVTRWSGAPLRCAKFFTGYEGLLAVAALRDLPVAVIISEFHREDDRIELGNARVLFFEVKDGGYQLMERPKMAADEACLVFEMYTACTDRASSLDSACATLTTLGLRTVVLAIAAAHAQYPDDVKVRETKARPKPFEDLEEVKHAHIAKEHDLGQSKYFRNGQHFMAPIGLNIKHTFAAMHSEIVQRQATLAVLHNTWIEAEGVSTRKDNRELRPTPTSDTPVRWDALKLSVYCFSRDSCRIYTTFLGDSWPSLLLGGS
ncbi:hypothetical protein BKA62DRAFT_716650 [Auriculariales sp. MPI-PUGE-AT-0066]|nr:hypothetical protein BKA62DRAFT_716650 [Auriculariales sp. MPI-PUGE-AT-0066]